MKRSVKPAGARGRSSRPRKPGTKARTKAGGSGPPGPGRRDPPLHELAPVDPEAVQMMALQHHREGAGTFRVDGNDPEAVVDAAPERDEHAVPDDGREDQRVQAHPPELGD